MPLTENDSVSQNASNAPLSSTLTDMSHLDVAAPYSPKQATEITPARRAAGAGPLSSRCSRREAYAL